jgi:hypothetical protein
MNLYCYGTEIDEPRQRVEALNFLVLLLPDVHRNTLEVSLHSF